MSDTTIYTASELRDRRTEILQVACRGRAVVRAVDGTALVFTPLDTFQRNESVAQWAIALHHVVQGETPGALRWLRHLDSDDRAEFVTEAVSALDDVVAGANLQVFDNVVDAWRKSALSLADESRRSVLLGDARADYFVEVQRPESND